MEVRAPRRNRLPGASAAIADHEHGQLSGRDAAVSIGIELGVVKSGVCARSRARLRFLSGCCRRSRFRHVRELGTRVVHGRQDSSFLKVKLELEFIHEVISQVPSARYSEDSVVIPRLGVRERYCGVGVS